MLPYLVAFTISALFVQLAVASARFGRLLQFTWCALSVLTISALAGVRDYTVGTDVLVYGNQLFNSALRSTDLGTYVMRSVREGIDGEYGYLFLNWLVSRFTNDVHWFYFVLALVAHGIVMTAVWLARRLQPALPPTLVWLVYLFTQYVDSLNMLRQGVALSLALLGLVLVLRRRPYLALVMGGIGLVFHNSAIVYFGIWGIVMLLQRVKRSMVWLAVILAGAVLLTVFSAQVLQLVTSLGIVSEKYTSYLAEGARTGASMGPQTMYRLVPLTAGLLMLRKPVNPAGRAAWLLLAIELVLLPMREIAYPLYRLLTYFAYAKVIAYPMIAMSFTTEARRRLAQVATVAFVALYFILWVSKLDDVTYTSDILSHLF
ncbi:MAG: EpsG family protein [Bifidobacteriaceae bacterium]|jgi:hypothetical protein|nr:EpsG family protein [Bifidobacteriaceae bacterium]